MGRTAKPRAADAPQKERDPRIAALLADNERLELERLDIQARPRTVENQITSQWILIRTLSNLLSIARVKNRIPLVVSLTNAISKCQTDMRGLQKIASDDKLDDIRRRQEGEDEALAILGIK